MCNTSALRARNSAKLLKYLRTFPVYLFDESSETAKSVHSTLILMPEFFMKYSARARARVGAFRKEIVAKKSFIGRYERYSRARHVCARRPRAKLTGGRSNEVTLISLLSQLNERGQRETLTPRVRCQRNSPVACTENTIKSRRAFYTRGRGGGRTIGAKSGRAVARRIARIVKYAGIIHCSLAAL